jgi:hypothetical protein
VVPKNVLQALVFALPLTVVGFAVLMGGSAVVRAMDDPFGASVLAWIAAAFLMVGVADGLVLLVILGLRALADDDQDNSTSAQG